MMLGMRGVRISHGGGVVTIGVEPWILEVVPDAESVGRRAADVVAEVVSTHPQATIAVPTGRTPLGMFAEINARVRREEIDLSRATLFCLDEYLGLASDDPNSLTRWLRNVFVAPAGIDPIRVVTLPATEGDHAAGAALYEAELTARGGLDLAVLGLGPNGHIAYNEPGSTANSRTRVVDLTPESIARAAEEWTGAPGVPGQAITIGVGTLLEARRIVLIVTGAGKADILCRALRDAPSAAVPASWLQLAAERLTVIVDTLAAARL